MPFDKLRARHRTYCSNLQASGLQILTYAHGNRSQTGSYQEDMKARTVLKLVALGTLIVAVGVLLQGQDVLTGIALVSLAMLVAAKIVSAFVHSRNRRSGGSGNGLHPNGVPVPRPPGRPPALSAAATADIE